MTDIFNLQDIGNKEATLEKDVAQEEAEIEADKNRIFFEQEKMEMDKMDMDFDFFAGTGLDEGKLNDLVAQSADTITSLNKEIEVLREKETHDKAELKALRDYEYASYLQRLAPTNYIEKKLRWYIADKSGCGTPEDSDFACPKLINYLRSTQINQGEKIKDINETRTIELIDETLQSIDNLTSLMDVLERLDELHSIRKMEYAQLKNAISKQQFTTWTSERKVVYEKSAVDYIDFIQFNISIFYYILFIVYLFIGDFFVKKRYKNYTSWILILIYLSIPVIMKKFVTILFYVKYQIAYFTSTRMPKDVYLNL